MSDENLLVTEKLNIPAPLDQVWDFLLNEEQMKCWFEADVFIIDPLDGGRIEIPFSFGGQECRVIGEIGLVYPKSKITFMWNEQTRTNEDWFFNTMITINLEADGDSTHLTLIHDGFKRLPPEIRDGVYKKYMAYWGESGIMERLQSLVIEK